MVAPHTEVYVEEIPKCNFCHHEAYADARLQRGSWSGSWGNVCSDHFDFYRCQLGLGKGQRLMLQKKPTDALSEEALLENHRHYIQDKTAEGDARLVLIVLSLEARLGRTPTEDEVVDFIFGDPETRNKIWNEGATP